MSYNLNSLKGGLSRGIYTGRLSGLIRGILGVWPTGHIHVRKALLEFGGRADRARGWEVRKTSVRKDGKTLGQIRPAWHGSSRISS